MSTTTVTPSLLSSTVSAPTGAGQVLTSTSTTAATWKSPAPTIQTYVSGSGTYTVPAGTTYLKIRMVGGKGGNSPFGGGGVGGPGNAAAPNAAIANTGSGGGGGGGPGAFANSVVGVGGGSGGYIEAVITSPAGTYSYAVGTAGTAGANGYAGSAGAAGVIIIEAYP